VLLAPVESSLMMDDVTDLTRESRVQGRLQVNASKCHASGEKVVTWRRSHGRPWEHSNNEFEAFRIMQRREAGRLTLDEPKTQAAPSRIDSVSLNLGSYLETHCLNAVDSPRQSTAWRMRRAARR
jgi:hypothetical protein